MYSSKRSVATERVLLTNISTGRVKVLYVPETSYVMDNTYPEKCDEIVKKHKNNPKKCNEMLKKISMKAYEDLEKILQKNNVLCRLDPNDGMICFNLYLENEVEKIWANEYVQGFWINENIWRKKGNDYKADKNTNFISKIQNLCNVYSYSNSSLIFEW